MNNANVNDAFHETLRNLKIIYNHINKHLFDGCLPEAVLITLEPDKRKRALGWYCGYCEWTHNGNRLKQINIVPEFLNRPYLDLCETMLHECVHLFCDIQNKGARSKYHNRDFKISAEAHGLIVEKGSLGWSSTSFKPETKYFFESFLKDNGFEDQPTIYRISPPKPVSAEPKPSIARYKCPDCEIVIHVPMKDDSEAPPTIHCPLCQKQMSVSKPRKKNNAT